MTRSATGAARRTARPASYDVVSLLEQILAGSADLRGAACTSHPRLFDPDISHRTLGYASADERHRQVAATCVGCPVRRECWAWVQRTPRLRVSGPTAATMHVGSVLRSVPSQSEEPPEMSPTVKVRGRRGARDRVRGSRHRQR